MISMKLAKTMFFDRKAVIDATDRATQKVFRRFGAFVRRVARSSIRKRKGISAPGQPPSSHTGLLKKFIYFGYDRAQRNVVIGPTRLNKIGNAPEALEYGGPSETIRGWGRKKQRKTVRIRPRPFMRPAFESVKPKLPDMWRNSVTA